MTTYKLHFVHVDSLYVADVTDRKAEAEGEAKKESCDEKKGERDDDK